ncbi:MAG TPA: hypothetical protein VF490_20360, partial [Chryseosolibacter sp.]
MRRHFFAALYSFRKKELRVPGWEEAGVPFANKFVKKISAAFSAEELDVVARETGFKMRRSKLTPLMFADAVLFKDAHG